MNWDWLDQFIEIQIISQFEKIFSRKLHTLFRPNLPWMEYSLVVDSHRDRFCFLVFLPVPEGLGRCLAYSLHYVHRMAMLESWLTSCILEKPFSSCKWKREKMRVDEKKLHWNQSGINMQEGIGFWFTATQRGEHCQAQRPIGPVWCGDADWACKRISGVRLANSLYLLFNPIQVLLT